MAADNLKLLPKREPSRARVTLSPSVDPNLVVVELVHGDMHVTATVEVVELRDLRSNDGER